MLLEKGANQDEIDKENDYERQGETHLHKCVEGGSVECLKLLLDKGADQRIKTTFNMYRNTGGETVLHKVAYRGNFEIVKILLERGGNPNVRNVCENATPLHKSAAGGSVDCLKLLLEKGAELKAKNSCRQIPLHYAASPGNIAASKSQDLRNSFETITSLKGFFSLASSQDAPAYRRAKSVALSLSFDCAMEVFGGRRNVYCAVSKPI